MATVAVDEGRGIRDEIGPSMELRLSPMVRHSLDRACSELGISPAEAITKAILLLDMAAVARHEGKAFGVAASADDLENEVVGLGPGSR